MNLAGKKILFIGIGFYDYEKLIVEKLEQSGASVSYMSSVSNMRPVNFLYRLGIQRLAMRFKDMRREKNISRTESDVDLVFVIKGQELSRENFDEIRRRNPNAQWILYLWDSLIRHTNIDLLFENFPIIYSFDRKDCQKYSRLKFRPLFFREHVDKSRNREYSLSFIGWAHSNRLEMIRTLKNQLKAAGKTYYLKLYYGPFDYLVQRFIKHTITREDGDVVIKRPIPYDKFKDVLSKSELVLDISHPLQSGLTMRTIETIAAGCRLLTTNDDIVNYPQVLPSYYYLLDRKNPNLPQEIVNDDERKHEDVQISEYFYIDNFLDEILESFGS